MSQVPFVAYSLRNSTLRSKLERKLKDVSGNPKVASLGIFRGHIVPEAGLPRILIRKEGEHTSVCTSCIPRYACPRNQSFNFTGAKYCVCAFDEYGPLSSSSEDKIISLRVAFQR